MGMGYSYRCKKCNTSKHFFLGIGFLGFEEHYTANNFKNLLEMAEEDQLLNLDEFKEFIKMEGTKLEEGFGNEIYVCKDCKFIECKFQYQLKNGKKTFTPKYKCKYCSGEMKLKDFDDEDFKIKCDECGSTEFEKSPMMLHWD